MPVAYWEFLLTKILFLELLYGILLVPSRCCFHHLVEKSILYKNDIQPFYIGPILFSENKIIRSVVGGKVDSQILFGTRSEKPKIWFGARGEKANILFGAKWQLQKILFGSQRVKFISTWAMTWISSCLQGKDQWYDLTWKWWPKVYFSVLYFYHMLI